MPDKLHLSGTTNTINELKHLVSDSAQSGVTNTIGDAQNIGHDRQGNFSRGFAAKAQSDRRMDAGQCLSIEPANTLQALKSFGTGALRAHGANVKSIGSDGFH